MSIYLSIHLTMRMYVYTHTYMYLELFYSETRAFAHTAELLRHRAYDADEQSAPRLLIDQHAAEAPLVSARLSAHHARA